MKTITGRAGFRLCACTLALGWIGAAAAQDFDRVVPKLPPAPEVPEVTAPANDMVDISDQRILIPMLKAIAFVPGLDSLQPAGVDPAGLASSIDVRGLPPIDDREFIASVQPFIGRPLTQGDLNAIGQLIRDRYRALERPFVDVTVPPQNVSNGVVQIVVTEYEIGDITVSGNRHFSADVIRKYGDLQPGETLTLPRLRNALEDYNQNPFLTVNAITSPGASTGLTNVELQARDRLPVRVYGGYDNQGVPTLDRDEWYLGFNWGNVLGSGDTLSYQYTRAFNGRYSSHSASTVVPIDSDNRVLVFGAYATQKPFLSDFFDSEGHSSQISFRWANGTHSSGGVNQGLQFGFDFKRTDNNLEFSGLRLLDSAVEIFQFPLIYTANIPDAGGETEVQVTAVWSPGNITPHNNDDAFADLIAFSDATYAYSRFSVTRTTRLPYEMSAVTRAMAQFASTNLPYSEQIGGGGIGSVRGYDSNTALGSQGAVLSQEIRSPAFSLFGDDGEFRDQMQLGAFIDYAWLRQPHPIPDTQRTEEMLSVGGGIHYLVGRYLDLQLEIGTQLKAPPGSDDRDTRGALVATVSY